MLFNIEHEGRRSLNVTREQALELGYPDAVVDAAEESGLNAAKLTILRDQIGKNAGDVASLLGTTADAAQLLLIRMAQMAAALAEATTLAEMRDAAKPFADLTADLLSDVDGGDVKMPYLLKGEAAVLEEISTRSTAVADTMIAAAAQDQAA